MGLPNSSSTDPREERVLTNPFLGTRSIAPESWRHQAACASTDPEVFFPGRGEWLGVIEAKKICLKCPVIESCRKHALQKGETFGVWGGMSENERRKARRARL